MRREERIELCEKYKGKTPTQVRNAEMAKISIEQVAAGQQVPTRGTYRNMLQEGKNQNKTKLDVFSSLMELAKIGNYIQKIEIHPYLKLVCFDPTNLIAGYRAGCLYNLYLDGTGELTHDFNGSKLELYQLTIENPIVGKAPISIAEGWLSHQSKDSIAFYLQTVKDFLISKNVMESPRRVVTDKSWAIILAVLKVFANER